MNYAQIGLFIIYIASMLMAGLTWHGWLVSADKKLNRFTHLGEALLLGAMIIVAQMLTLSLAGLYKTFFLWGMMAINILCVSLPHVRRDLIQVFARSVKWDAPIVVFILFIIYFAFRNCYLLMDIDSHTEYLFTQKLWLERGSSIYASTAVDTRIFPPQFQAVPYALGLSIFPFETFFPQMVVAFWTVIVVLLVFGYVSHRWGRTYAIAAVMLVLLDDHMFYSGANTSVVINSALIAFLFAGTYNFWESRRQRDPLRWVLAVTFLTQVLANKYQMTYALPLLVLLGMLIQPNLKENCKELIRRPKYGISILLGVLIFGLWPLKNYLSTGCPFFPFFADRLHIFNWTSDKLHDFYKINFGPLSFNMCIKYFNYLLTWPGVKAGILFSFLIFLWPMVFLSTFCKEKR